MEAKASLRHARISPRKVQIVLDLIRNKPADQAMAILRHTPKAACEPLSKLLKSAMANAENNFNMDRDSLYVSECYDEAHPSPRPGPRLQGAQEDFTRVHHRQGTGIKLKEEVNYGPKSESARPSCRCN